MEQGALFLLTDNDFEAVKCRMIKHLLPVDGKLEVILFSYLAQGTHNRNTVIQSSHKGINGMECDETKLT